MRWPHPSFFQSLVVTMFLTVILVGLIALPLLEFTIEPVRASGTIQPAAIIDFAFQPLRINITAGTKVVWTNNGNTQHTVTSSPQTNTTQSGTPLISSGPLSPRQNFSSTFYKHGLYPIQCAFHPATMNGLVNVTGTDVQPPSSPMTTLTDYTPYAIIGAVAATIVIVSAAFLFRRRIQKNRTNAPSRSS